MATDVELCSGCGAVALTHPMVGVARDQETGLMTAYPVCRACWTTPQHRTHPLKMHFFERPQAPQAVKNAEDNIMVSPPPSPPGKRKR